MSITRFSVIGFIAIFSTVLSTSANAPIVVDSRIYEQSIKAYSNGSLVQPDQLQDEGKGIVKIFRPRNRRYGALEMISLLEYTAAELEVLYPKMDRLQVGDIAQEKGGKISGHDSHTNGLDADVAYFRTDLQEIDPKQVKGFFLNDKHLSYVTADGKGVTADFDVERNFKFIELLYSSNVLGRIFMDAAIKRTFCEYTKAMGTYKQSIELLRKLRPWPHHDDHMHIRVDCPTNSKRCVKQDPIPDGSGCEEPIVNPSLSFVHADAC